MRAVRFDGETVRVVTNAPDPVLLPGEALVHPTRVLVGEADAAAMTTGASSSRLIGVIGHQFVGVVKKINLPDAAERAGVGGVGGGGGARAAARVSPLTHARTSLLGKRVVGSPVIVCTQCDLCRAGLPGHCRARRVMGLWAREGCFADLFAIPLANLVAVPDNVEDDRAVFSHLASSAAQAGHMLRATGKPFITVIGDTAAAMVTAQLLARQNKGTRLLYSRADRARLCERWGIKHRSLEEPGRRQDQDVVVDCTGTPAGLRLALQLVRPRGVVLLKSSGVGVPFPPGQPFAENREWTDSPGGGVDLTPVVTNEVQVIGCRDATIADGLGAMADGGIDVTSLITRRFKLDDATSALSAAASGEQAAVVMDV